MTNIKEFRKPIGVFIGRGDETQKLYKLEEKRDVAFKNAAAELGRLLELEDFYHEVVPEAILSFLEGWETGAVVAACQAYLKKRKP